MNLYFENNDPVVQGLIHYNTFFPSRTQLEITETPKDQTVKEGEPARFSCRVRGQPLPQITWFFEGDLITADEIYVLEEGPEPGQHALFLPEAFPEDAGLYTLRVTNPHGTREANAMLTVQGECGGLTRMPHGV